MRECDAPKESPVRAMQQRCKEDATPAVCRASHHSLFTLYHLTVSLFSVLRTMHCLAQGGGGVAPSVQVHRECIFESGAYRVVWSTTYIEGAAVLFCTAGALPDGTRCTCNIGPIPHHFILGATQCIFDARETAWRECTCGLHLRCIGTTKQGKTYRVS